MYKIREIRFKNHPILKNLILNFCDSTGHAVDTVIIAGENGTGKSTILNFLYVLFSGNVKNEAEVILENNDSILKLDYYYDSNYENIWARDHQGLDALPGSKNFLEKYNLNGVFSDVDINFSAQNLSTVTSMA